MSRARDGQVEDAARNDADCRNRRLFNSRALKKVAASTRFICLSSLPF
jgi:hypothetical protein